MTQQQMFNSFQAKDNTHYSKRSDDICKELINESSRNNLKPIRTFGRDISNINTKESK